VAHFSNSDEKKGKEKGARERKKKMPKILRARQPFDEKGERQVRRLAGSRHGPADWILRARIVTRSWDGQRVDTIASDLHCGAQTVRRCLHRFNEEGFEGLGDRPRPGRKPRLTAIERRHILALASRPALGHVERKLDGTLEAQDGHAPVQWSLDALTEAAQAAGIQVQRSQIRRILQREGIHWRHMQHVGTNSDPHIASKGQQSFRSTPGHPQVRPLSIPKNHDR